MIVDNKGKIFEDRRKSNKNVEKDRRKEIQIEKIKLIQKRKNKINKEGCRQKVYSLLCLMFN